MGNPCQAGGNGAAQSTGNEGVSGFGAPVAAGGFMAGVGRNDDFWRFVLVVLELLMLYFSCQNCAFIIGGQWEQVLSDGIHKKEMVDHF